MAVPEVIENLAIAGQCRIEIDRDGLGLITEIVISWMRFGTAAVTDARAQDPVETPKLGIRAPESSNAEGGGFIRDLGGFTIEWQCLG